MAFIVAGDFHDEAQVGLDHVFARALLVAFLDARLPVGFSLVGA